MDAKPLLLEVGRRMHEVGLEAVLIENAAAALRALKTENERALLDLVRAWQAVAGTATRAAHSCPAETGRPSRVCRLTA